MGNPELIELIELIDTMREEFDTIEDPRVERSRLHNIDDIIIISLIACICGMNDVAHIHEFAKCKKQWFSEFLNLPHGIPSVATFRRVFAVLDPETFNACFEAWTHRLQDVSQGQVIALDGKVVRRSKERHSGRRAINIVNAWASGNRLVIGQQPIHSKYGHSDFAKAFKNCGLSRRRGCTQLSKRCRRIDSRRRRRLSVEREGQSSHAQRGNCGTI